MQKPTQAQHLRWINRKYKMSNVLAGVAVILALVLLFIFLETPPQWEEKEITVRNITGITQGQVHYQLTAWNGEIYWIEYGDLAAEAEPGVRYQITYNKEKQIMSMTAPGQVIVDYEENAVQSWVDFGIRCGIFGLFILLMMALDVGAKKEWLRDNPKEAKIAEQTKKARQSLRRIHR